MSANTSPSLEKDLAADQTPRALADLRILDLSRILAGPWCTQNLADLGAEVIKIERPGKGDDTRAWGPPWLPNEAPGSQRDSSYYSAANRGKKSVTVDITTVEGQEIIHALVKNCDVVVENFKVGNLKKYGLDYDTLRNINPAIIYCSITGFGQTGPYAHRPGYDFVFQGMGGMMSITGERDDLPGGGPQKVGIALADIVTGMYATTAILAAVHYRSRTGQGQHIDMALLDSIVALGSNQVTAFFAAGDIPKRMGNAHMSLVPYGVYPTRNGHIIIAIGNDQQWMRFCELIERPDLASDQTYATVSGRIINRTDLDAQLIISLKKQDSDTWLRLLEQGGVPCGPINNYSEVFQNPQVQHRQLHVRQERHDGARIDSAASPLRLSETPPAYDLPPPIVGQHTDEVLQAVLDMSSERLAQLRARRIL